jgi:hypothetical protein
VFLKMATAYGGNIELPSDMDMMRMYKRGIRGGVTQVSKRYARANNPLCPWYDPSKPDTWLVYLDANSLYPTAMREPLPVGDHEWVKDLDDFTNKEHISSLDPVGERGYLLMIDIPAVPERLHDLMNDYPPCPETTSVKAEQASPYNQNAADNNKYKISPESKVLLCHFEEKKEYVIHYRLLQYMIELGLFEDVDKITVHKVISFRQEAIFAPYIDKCTKLRRDASNEFEKDLYKLMMNSNFGKSMEDVEKRASFEYFTASETDRFLKQAGKPRFKGVTIVDNHYDKETQSARMVCVEMRKQHVVYDKPIFMGQAILDMSKLHMLRFHYGHMLPKYGNDTERVKLLMTDTDSLIYEVRTEDIYKDMLADQDLYDCSAYSADHMLYNPKNKKVLGKFKDECPDQPLIEFVGCKAKMYALKNQMGKESKKAKGCKKSVVKRDLNFEKYLACISPDDPQNANIQRDFQQTTLRTKKHQIYALSQTRIGLNPIDMKRYVCDDGIHTLTYGHRGLSPL